MTVDTLQQHITSKKILTAAVVIVGLLFFAHGLHMSANNVAANNRMGSQLGELKTILQNQPPNGQETIIMTRDPWEVNYSTRYKAIQIPCDDLETIYRVAAIYKANYLLLPAPRPSLDNIYSGETTDTRFELVAAIPNSNLKLFRIKFAE